MICSVMTCSVLKQFGALDLGKVFGFAMRVMPDLVFGYIEGSGARV